MKKRERHPFLKGLLIFCAIMYLSAMVVVTLFQRRLIFFPSREHPQSQYTQWNEYDSQIGWKKISKSQKHIWLFFHGNRGNVLTRDFILKCIPAEDSVYAVEYPGYGFRNGSPSKRSIDAAADEAFAALRAKNPGVPIVVVGESIGSGPACHLAKHASPPEKIILAVPFDNFPSVAQSRMFYVPAKWLVADRWNNVESLEGYKGKLEIYALSNDKVVPSIHARRLYRAYPDAVYHECDGVHRDWWKAAGILSAE
jgi:uncharacterized protein